MYSIENFRAFNVRCFSDLRTFFNSELLLIYGICCTQVIYQEFCGQHFTEDASFQLSIVVGQMIRRVSSVQYQIFVV